MSTPRTRKGRRIAQQPVVVLSRLETERMLTSRRAPSFDAVLSIGSPGEPPPRGLIRNGVTVLRLEFDDRSSPTSPRAPTKEDVARGVQFVLDQVRRGRRLLIHCHAGISRSAAFAVVANHARLSDARQARAAVMAGRPIARPNQLILGYAEQVLQLPSGTYSR